MRVLLVRPHPVLPELFAGTEMNLHFLCRALIGRDHHVMVAAATKVATGTDVTVDQQCGYPVARSGDVVAAADFAAARFRPDICVVTQPAQWTRRLSPSLSAAPFVVYEQEVSTGLLALPAEIAARAVYIANSRATREHLSREFGLASTVIPPLFGIEEYAGIQRHGDRVLFVSLQRRKGPDVAIRLAQLRPRVPFTFVESWTQNAEHTQKLREFVRTFRNIELLPNQRGLTHVMPHIKLLLMPSRSQEAWGRTATEAQICGIPVLGSSRGNLPFTIGQGGITLDPDEPIGRWLDEFDRIMNDSVVYEELSSRAREQGERMIAKSRRGLQEFEQILLSTVAKYRS